MIENILHIYIYKYAIQHNVLDIYHRSILRFDNKKRQFVQDPEMVTITLLCI